MKLYLVAIVLFAALVYYIASQYPDTALVARTDSELSLVMQ